MVSSVISGATKVEHVMANAKASGWDLADDEYQEVKEILES